MDLVHATAPKLLKEFESKLSKILTIVEHYRVMGSKVTVTERRPQESCELDGL